MRIANYRSAAIDSSAKGLGMVPGTTIALVDAARLEWNLLDEDLSLPSAVLYADRLEHNLAWMQKFTTAYGVKLAPHGKTTMAPSLFRKQLAAGAWGITLATAAQVRAAYWGGVRRIIMANQLIGRRNMAMIAEIVSDPEVEFFCCVDSVEGVDQLGAFFQRSHRSVNVLLELGVTGARAGVRNRAQAEAVLAAIARWPDSIGLAGIEFYEGVLHDEAAVRELLSQVLGLARELSSGKRFARATAILSGAGSEWYDVVADELHQLQREIHPDGTPCFEIILRPGCYLTHDAGIYKTAQQHVLTRNPTAQQMQSSLLPALQVWAYVQSIPEPDRAIIGVGRRDIGVDSGMPVPARHYRPNPSSPAAPLDLTESCNWEIFQMMDQHGFMRIKPGDDIQVGDMLAFDISHPCLTFDKWRQLVIVDPSYRVIEVVETCF